MTPLPHSRQWRSVGTDDRCASGPEALRIGSQSYLLDRFYFDNANPLLRNWSSDQFMQGSRSPWPLVLYGPSGVGKTLLAESLVRRLSKNYRYTTGADFRRQFIEACETRSVRRFQDHFAAGDVLLIDDLVAPASETSLVSELVRLFDTYHEFNRPVLVTTNVAPFGNDHFSPALRSRLSGGLSISVQPPDQVARQAVLEHLLGRYGLNVESAELEWLTEQLPKTVPALGREVSRIALNSQSTTESPPPAGQRTCGREELVAWIGNNHPELDVRSFGVILQLVSRRFRLKGAEIVGKGRQRQRVKARGALVWLVRHCYDAPYSRIGQLLGKRDASTVRHAFDCTERQRVDDSRLEKMLRELVDSVEKRTSATTPDQLVKPSIVNGG